MGIQQVTLVAPSLLLLLLLSLNLSTLYPSLAMVLNSSLVYVEPPSGFPIPGKTLKKVTDDSFNPETIKLDGGVLIKTKAISLDPYMRFVPVFAREAGDSSSRVGSVRYRPLAE